MKVECRCGGFFPKERGTSTSIEPRLVTVDRLGLKALAAVHVLEGCSDKIQETGARHGGTLL